MLRGWSSSVITSRCTPSMCLAMCVYRYQSSKQENPSSHDTETATGGSTLSQQDGGPTTSAQRKTPPHAASKNKRPLSEMLRDAKHDVYTFLTTSPRQRELMRDAANIKQMSELQRSRVHWVNDVFMSEGKGGRDTVDDRTFEKGLAWSFMVPVVLLIWVCLLILIWYARAGRHEKITAATLRAEEEFSRKEEQMKADIVEYEALLNQISVGGGPTNSGSENGKNQSVD